MQSYFYSAEYFIYSFVKNYFVVLLLSSVLYFSFYHLPFVTLSTYFHILWLSHVWFYFLYAKFYSLFVNLKMISERSKRRKILSLVLILKWILIYWNWSINILEGKEINWRGIFSFYVHPSFSLEVITCLDHAIHTKNSIWTAVNLNNATSLSFKPKLAISPRDTGQQVLCFNSFHLNTAWMSVVKDVPMMIVLHYQFSWYRARLSDCDKISSFPVFHVDEKFTRQVIYFNIKLSIFFMSRWKFTHQVYYIVIKCQFLNWSTCLYIKANEDIAMFLLRSFSCQVRQFL